MSREHSENRRCIARGCDKRTRENKPYCPDHVAQHPYVADLLKQIHDRQNELDQVRYGSSFDVDVKGPMATEILVYLRARGASTVSGIARDRLKDDIEVAARFVEALERAGLVVEGRRIRGFKVVHLL